MSREFAVIDVETTGIYPKNDRIIEIAILRLDKQGQQLTEYTTLINPQRDLGPTHIHNITGAHVANAPEFQEVAGDILELLHGATVVAHNAVFDKGFVASEFFRIGIRLPEFPTICTLNLAAEIDGSIPSRRLVMLCNHFGIPLMNAHSAYADAEATAKLLRVFSNKLGGWEKLEDFIEYDDKETSCQGMPAIEPSGICYTRSDSMIDVERDRSFLSQMAMQLPSSSTGPKNVNEYMALLDEALEDRRLDEDEVCSLHGLALHLGLSSHDAGVVHTDYLASLVKEALSDRVITETEMEDLVDVQRLISVSGDVFHAIILREQKNAEKNNEDSLNQQQMDLRGKTICFSGTFRSRVGGVVTKKEGLEKLAEEAGLDIKSGVSKKLDFLVLADPHSMSGKAKKARQYGTRILAESVFLNYMGVNHPSTTA
jgi:DNA polymerase-3 subunit epsilon